MTAHSKTLSTQKKKPIIKQAKDKIHACLNCIKVNNKNYTLYNKCKSTVDRHFSRNHSNELYEYDSALKQIYSINSPIIENALKKSLLGKVEHGKGSVQSKKLAAPSTEQNTAKEKTSTTAEVTIEVVQPTALSTESGGPPRKRMKVTESQTSTREEPPTEQQGTTTHSDSSFDAPSITQPIESLHSDSPAGCSLKNSKVQVPNISPIVEDQEQSTPHQQDSSFDLPCSSSIIIQSDDVEVSTINSVNQESEVTDLPRFQRTIDSFMLTNTNNEEGNSTLISDSAQTKTLKEVVLENNSMLQEIKAHLFESKAANLSSNEEAKSMMIMKSNNPNLLKLRQATSMLELLLIDNTEVSLKCKRVNEKEDSEFLFVCNICNYYLMHGELTESIHKAAGASFASGYCLSKHKYDILCKGLEHDDLQKKKQWTNFKSHLISHHTTGSFHSKAVEFQEKVSSRDDRTLKVTKTIVAAALTCTSVNAAAEHFTPLLSMLQISGADVGQIGHSK